MYYSILPYHDKIPYELRSTTITPSHGAGIYTPTLQTKLNHPISLIHINFKERALVRVKKSCHERFNQVFLQRQQFDAGLIVNVKGVYFTPAPRVLCCSCRNICDLSSCSLLETAVCDALSSVN